MIQQLLRMAASTVHEHCEPTIAVPVDETDHADRLQSHLRSRAWRLLRNHLENISIQLGDADALDTVSIGPRPQIEDRPVRRDMPRVKGERLLQSGVDAIDVNMQLGDAPK